jgi:serine/threonine-protein kinase RsbT
VHVERTNKLEVRSAEDVVKVRQEVRNRTAAVGFSLVDQTKFVTAASEIARNTIDHGGGGIAQVETISHAGRRGVRLVFEDEGPGIADIALAMQDGYSSAGGLGMGLPGSKRLSNEFYVESIPGKGTKVILVRWKNA